MARKGKKEILKTIENLRKENQHSYDVYQEERMLGYGSVQNPCLDIGYNDIVIQTLQWVLGIDIEEYDYDEM